MKKILTLFLTAVISISSIYTVFAENYTIIREPIYNMADTFYSNVTKVSKDSKWGICDTNGYLITDYEWEAMGEIADELIPAKKNGLWGYINCEGAVIIDYQFVKADNFNGNLARVLMPEGKYAYINRGGVIEFVSPFDYSYTESGGAICGVKDNLYGYCDTAGNIIIQPQFEMGFDFHNGFAAVKFGDKWGYITTYGAYNVRPQFNHASDYKNGYAVCSLSTGYGIIDKTGAKTSPFNYDYIGECDSSGRFPAKKGTTVGYINFRGDWVMQLDYDFCYGFTDGIARVFKNGLWGYIDENGQEIVPPIFADCSEYRNGRAFYSTDGVTYGFLTLGADAETPEKEPGVVAPQNPAQDENGSSTPKPTLPSVPTTPEPPVDENKTEGTYEEIIDVNDIENIPTFPGENRCISMKIGSTYALKSETAKKMVTAPTLIDGVTMVPLRDVVEFMGGTISWDEKTQRIKAEYRYSTISIVIGSKLCFINGIAGTTSAAPRLIDGVTMIPIRSVASGLGCKVEWIPETQNIYIYY